MDLKRLICCRKFICIRMPNLWGSIKTFYSKSTSWMHFCYSRLRKSKWICRLLTLVKIKEDSKQLELYLDLQRRYYVTNTFWNQSFRGEFWRHEHSWPSKESYRELKLRRQKAKSFPTDWRRSRQQRPSNCTSTQTLRINASSFIWHRWRLRQRAYQTIRNRWARFVQLCNWQQFKPFWSGDSSP